MVVVVNLSSIKNIDKKAVVQYSYPIANITSSSSNVFSLRFNGFNPNFSASFKNTYISGVCIKATLANKTHNINNNNAELVLEHKKSDNTTFYVVIPLIFDTATQSTKLDPLFSSEEDRVIDLDSVLKKKSNIFCYKNDSNAAPYIFVFETPVYIKKEKPSNLSYFDKFNGIKSDSKFKITNGQNIENEIECEYVTETDISANTPDKKMLTTILSWTFILLGLIVCWVYILTMVANKADPDSANTVYMIGGGIGFVLFMMYIRLFTNTTTKKIEYGSMTFFSIMVLLLSLIAYNGYFIKNSI